jgi:hypothetical protein
MAEQCVICVEDLDSSPAIDVAAATESKPSNSDLQPAIALIKPCNHILHDECLRTWAQTANSCPLCRGSFNLVQVLDRPGGKSSSQVGGGFTNLPGTVQSEYTVENKKQVAEFDPSAWIDGDEDEEEEEGTPCPVCGEADQPEILLLCDGCDASYHTHCIGLDRVPNGDWFCMECADSGAYQRAAENASNRPEPVSGRHAPRTQASVNRSARRTRVNAWAGAWGAISRRLHNAAGVEVDFLDFEDDDHMDSFRLYQDRTAAERREFARWQQRISIAQRQGVSANTFRPAAHSRTRPRTPSATIQTAEERQAWGAFERAQSIENRSPRGRKRKSTTSSPVQEQEEPERKLKRPRTR